ncbi:hypothetical protein CMQ_7577 [Grosmannia clavigera kw1407]|uniref:BTB domain-containing protein n=1 Tax=Grosmannia clavigera (strain kw1407 / UAMH 11150) TaxID=655863 RepID=F0XNY0_GROCL|nr:uncharacterized protein CMQ_7577 [Grosmannia clavigera kw1407]EFX00575.1 hypothetical protein CMQ_7577 [Grosmannia clavigera kw1407]
MMSSEEAPAESIKTADVADVEMGEAAVEATPEAIAAGDDNSGTTESAALVVGTSNVEGSEETEKAEAKRTSFTTYLRSPVVTLRVGEDEKGASLTAHQALLVQSPYFAQLCAAFTDDGSPRTIDLADQNVDAVGCFLEYLYTSDYFPRKVPGHAHQLETDPDLPDVDETGEQLLKHARVYTLASWLEMPALQALASSKIHCVNSTAKGEIAYARYVYEYTAADDKAVRSPVAKFWATRSHTLRAEAEKEFQALCLEFPQFAYDVLTRVLDEKLKRERDDRPHSVVGSARKRARNSAV